MISLEHIDKIYQTGHGPTKVLTDVNLRVMRGERVAIIGGNGAGKSTLIRIISGIEQPTNGVVDTRMRISWPLAFSGAFQGSLTGIDNVRFISRIYGQDWREALDFVADFSQLGKYLREPIKTYSSGMRARLAFAISMTVEFDCYLLDEVFAVGDARFQARCQDELFGKRADRGFIIVSHDARFLYDHCNRGSVLRSGVLTHYASLVEAQESHDEYMRSGMVKQPDPES
jgi:ABC-type polysaccharide/polyol phosphate transport system ATPase subunit